MTLQTALRQGRDLLGGGGVAEPKLTAEVLLMHALRRDRSFLHAHPEHELSELEWIHYGRYLHERLKGKPTQYITRMQEFYGRNFAVTPAVLIPRPETEHSVECALEKSPGVKRVIDVGTGSGALAVTLALELRTRAVATDISPPALTVARENARSLGANVDFVCCDLLSGIGVKFDLVVSNPPYVPDGEIPGLQREVREWEPHVALSGGEDGADLYRRLIPEAGRVLNPGGWLVMEIGYRSEPPVRAAFDQRWSGIETRLDLAGLPRVICAQWRG
jgi:release factor glutamine methyltransferase